jgi:hypothetical protein
MPRIIELVKTRIPQRFGLDPVRDIQVLCPMNRGGVGARSLNIELQTALNPAGERKVERFGWTFAPGDKIMQIENDYDKDVYNGDIGYIDDVDPDAGELTARFDGRAVAYGFGELDTLVPAYAATTHKSQGSVPRRRNPRVDPALRHAAAQPALYRRHAREAPRRAGRPEEGRRHCLAQRVGTTTVVETERMVGRTCDASPAKVGDGLIMAVSDLDILRAAHLHLERHGDQAVTKAREIVRTLKERGDDDGADTWLRIIVAIETMRQEPSGRHPAPDRG